jgi:MFS family permease
VTDGATAPSSAVRNVSIAAYVVSVLCATMALAAQTTALGVQVFNLNRRELDLGLVGLAEFLPAVLLVLVTGPIADRFDRRRVVQLAMTAEVAATLVLAVIARRQEESLGLILAMVFCFGVARSFATPAVRALPANLVPPKDLPRVIALNSLSWQVGLIVGPVLGGVLYAIDPALPYLAAAVLLLIGALAMFAVRVLPQPMIEVDRLGEVADTEPESRPPELGDALEGLRVVRRTPMLLGAISLDLCAVLFGGAVALLPAIAEERLGVGPAGLGWLRAAGGIGASLVTVCLAVRPLRRRVGSTLFFVVGVFGAATIGLGLTRSFWIAFAMMLVLSGADAVSVFIRSTLVPLVTPDEVRGRVLAVESVFIGASNELGAFESGVLGQAIGASGSIVFGGVATMVVVVVFARFFPALRHVDRFEDLRPAAAT